MRPFVRYPDIIATIRGIVAAAEERYPFDMQNSDVSVPLGLLMQAADEIAIARDLAAGNMPRHERSDPTAPQTAQPDPRRGGSDPRAAGDGDAAEGDCDSPAGQPLVRVSGAEGQAPRRGRAR